jgi:hypothetical protein
METLNSKEFPHHLIKSWHLSIVTTILIFELGILQVLQKLANSGLIFLMVRLVLPPKLHGFHSNTLKVLR